MLLKEYKFLKNIFRKNNLFHFLILFVLFISFSIFTFFISYFFSSFSLFSNFQEVYAQEAISIFDYFTEEQMIVFILYSSYDELIELAKTYNIAIEKDEKKLKIALLKYFKLDLELIEIGDHSILIIKNADYFYTINYNEDNINIAKLIGNIYIFFDNKIILADKITFDLKNQQILAKGNVTFIDNNSTYYADEIYFNLKTSTGFFYNVKGKIDNYYLIGEFIQKLTGKAYFGNNVKISTCENEKMHYYILSSSFFYSDKIIMSFNNTLYIGSSAIFWLPIVINTNFGVGFPGDFGFLYSKREGFQFYNTFYFNSINSNKKNILWVDIYEKLGIAGLLNLESNGLKLIGGIAYSQYLFYNSNYDIWTPYSSELNILNPIKLIRYGIDIDLSEILFDFIKLSIHLSYTSDPYFSYDFIDRKRKIKVDLNDFVRTYYPNIFPEAKTSYEESVSLSFNYRIFNFSILSKALYNLYIVDEEYIYTPGYGYYYPNYLNYYSIRLNANYLNLGSKYLNFNSNIGFSSSYNEIQNKDYEKLNSYFINNINFPINFMVNFSGIFGFNLNLNNSISYNETKNLKTIEINNKNSSYNLNLSTNTNINLNFLKFNANYSFSYKNYFFIENQKGFDSSKLNLSININLLYDIIIINLSNYINLFNNQTKDIFYFDYKNISNMKISTKFNPNKIINLNYSTEYSIIYNIFLYHNYSLNINILNLNFYDFKINLYDFLSYLYDTVNIFNSSFKNNFSLRFTFKDSFLIEIIVSSFNDYIYSYDNFRELIIDLLKSFNFFNINDRLESNFKFNNMSINLMRDYHDFVGYLTFSGSYVYNSLKNLYDFKIVIFFGIRSKIFSSLNFEDFYEMNF